MNRYINKRFVTCFTRKSFNTRQFSTMSDSPVQLTNPNTNKGSAFSKEEREKLKLQSWLPYGINSLDNQVKRAYRQYQDAQTNLGKNAFLISMRDQNTVLFYALLQKHLIEMLPIIYTPTEGEAIKKFSTLFRKPEGCFLSYPHIKSQEDIEELYDNHVKEQNSIDLIVVSDGEQILGIGDQGVGGMGISTAKATLYTALAGIDPVRTVSICLDVGTNNKSLLDDPLYLGWKSNRIEGEEYETFINQFVSATRTKFPNALIHFEDFGLHNAKKILDTYQSKHAVFNDDIQGTGAVTLACIKSALIETGGKIEDARVVIFGAGTAGMGICEQIADAMHFAQKDNNSSKGKSIHDQFWIIDKEGLIFDDMIEKDARSGFAKTRANFARKSSEREKYKNGSSLLDVVKEIQPTILIGTSTQPGAFTQEIVESMSKNVEKPIILPLSNPTELHECTPKDALKWSKGKAIIATGSPFDPVKTDSGNTIFVSECNNALIYPGIGLGAIISKTNLLTKSMIVAASNALSKEVTKEEREKGMLLPDLERVQEVNVNIAVAVIEQSRKDGNNQRDFKDSDDINKIVRAYQWKAEYK